MNEYAALAIIAAVVVVVIVSKRKPRIAPPSSGADWRIGPVINGENYSRGMPPRPTPAGAGWYIDIPPLPSHVNYVQRFGGHAPQSSITIRYRVEGGPITQVENGQPATAGLSMIQRKGDNLSARGKYAGYRWFSHLHLPLTEGEHDCTVTLDPSEWGPTVSDPQAASFAECVANVESLAIVFGGAGGRGHGVYGSGRFTLLSLG